MKPKEFEEFIARKLQDSDYQHLNTTAKHAPKKFHIIGALGSGA